MSRTWCWCTPLPPSVTCCAPRLCGAPWRRPAGCIPAGPSACCSPNSASTSSRGGQSGNSGESCVLGAHLFASRFAVATLQGYNFILCASSDYDKGGSPRPACLCLGECCIHGRARLTKVHCNRERSIRSRTNAKTRLSSLQEVPALFIVIHRSQIGT